MDNTGKESGVRDETVLEMGLEWCWFGGWARVREREGVGLGGDD